MPQVMERYSAEQIEEDPSLTNKFYYKARILKGFSFRYHFNVGKSFVVDETKESSESRFGRLTNWVQAEDKNTAPAGGLMKFPTFYASD